jgi:hypothetical protein
MRIKTNILYLSQCKTEPCKKYLDLFKKDENGELFILIDEAFREMGQQYWWLYKNTNVDFVGWEIENGRFDWENDSAIVAICCPEHFDPEKFNWTDYSWTIAEYCPQLFDADRFNWESYSRTVVIHCPENFDAEKFNWKEHSSYVAEHCPHLLDPIRYNWADDTWAVEKYCPALLKLKP